MKKVLGMSTGPTANSAGAGYHTGGKSGNRSRGPKATSSSVQDSYYKLEEDGLAMKDLKSESTEHLREDQQPGKLAVPTGAAAITRTTHIVVTEDSRSTSDGGSNPDMYMTGQQKAPWGGYR
jgi:hypothetical protein